MKKIVSLLLVLLLALTSTLAVSAEGIKDVFAGLSARGNGSGSCGTNVTWSYDDATQALTITGTGAMQDYDVPNEYAPWVMYCYYNDLSVASVSISSGITHIGDYAFYSDGGYVTMTSVTIPNTVTSIGEGAFGFDTNLASVTLSNNLTTIGDSAFAYSGVTNITIPSGVTSIGDDVFAYSALSNITIPSSVTSIGVRAFAYSNLASVSIPSSVTSIGDYAFDNSALASVSIPSGVTYIGEAAFRNTNLTSVTIPSGITTIANSTFQYCNNLQSVTLPNTVTTIDVSAFNYCTSLTSISLPSSLRSINGSAFAFSGLTSITIPNGVERIESYAFGGTPITSVSIPASVTFLSSEAFGQCNNLAAINVNASNPKYSSQDGVLFDKDITELMRYPAAKTGSSYTVPSTVKYIDSSAFYNNANLQTVTFPSETVFVANVFYDNTNIQDVYFNGSLTEVYTYNDLPAQTRIHGYNPSGAYDFCVATETTNRFVPITTGHTVSYNANQGTFSGGTPASQSKVAGQPLTVTNTVPTRSGYEFMGWATAADYVPEETYFVAPGGQYTFDSTTPVTLYAVWCHTGSVAENGLTTKLYDQRFGNDFMTTRLPYMAKNLDTDGKPAGIDTDVNRNTTTDWENELKKPWADSNRYDNADNSFLTLDSDGYYSFDSALQTATYDKTTHRFTVTSGGEIFLPVEEDYYFGIQMSGDFTMPKDGKVQCGNSLDDMKYEFNGDDLVYVYIDGVKIINGGSSYGAAHTSVNFATGEVVTIPDGRYSGNGGGLTTTTLRALYSAAYEEKYPNNTTAQRDAYLAEIFENVGGNYVFKEGSSHSFDMFYAETGAGDSNCRVKLNMLFDPQSNETYTLTYNSGSKTFTDTTTSKSDGNAYMYGDNASAADNSGAYAMTLGNSVFLGWGLDSTDTTVDYEPGDTFPIYKDTILYAKFSTPTQSGLTNNIIFWDGTTMLQHEAITNASATYTLTKNPIQSPESGVTNIVNGLPTRAGRIFAGWYETQAAATARTAASAYPRSFVISTKQDASNNVNLYAGWVVVGTVTKASGDEKNYGTNTLGGFSMQGVQIRDTDITDPYQDSDRNKVEKGIRFVTVYSKSMLSELGSLRASGGDHTDGDFNVYQNGAVRYGYVLYGGNDIQNGESSHKLTLNTYGMVQTDCTKADHNRDHRNFNDYILSTTVVKFDDAGSDAYMNRYLEARAYVAYTDANGYQRGAYSTYSEGRFWGGCRTTFNAVKTWFTLQKV